MSYGSFHLDSISNIFRILHKKQVSTVFWWRLSKLSPKLLISISTIIMYSDVIHSQDYQHTNAAQTPKRDIFCIWQQQTYVSILCAEEIYSSFNSCLAGSLLHKAFNWCCPVQEIATVQDYLNYVLWKVLDPGCTFPEKPGFRVW